LVLGCGGSGPRPPPPNPKPPIPNPQSPILLIKIFIYKIKIIKKKIINLVSSNKNKLRELNEMFDEHFKVKQLDIDLP